MTGKVKQIRLTIDGTRTDDRNHSSIRGSENKSLIIIVYALKKKVTAIMKFSCCFVNRHNGFTECSGIGETQTNGRPRAREAWIKNPIYRSSEDNNIALNANAAEANVPTTIANCEETTISHREFEKRILRRKNDDSKQKGKRNATFIRAQGKTYSPRLIVGYDTHSNNAYRRSHRRPVWNPAWGKYRSRNWQRK